MNLSQEETLNSGKVIKVIGFTSTYDQWHNKGDIQIKITASYYTIINAKVTSDVIFYLTYITFKLYYG